MFVQLFLERQLTYLRLIYSTSEKPICVGRIVQSNKKLFIIHTRPEDADAESREKRVRFGLLFLPLPLSSRGRKRKKRRRRRRRRNSNRLAATSHFSSRGGADEVGEPPTLPTALSIFVCRAPLRYHHPGNDRSRDKLQSDFSSMKIQPESQ